MKEIWDSMKWSNSCAFERRESPTEKNKVKQKYSSEQWCVSVTPCVLAGRWKEARSLAYAAAEQREWLAEHPWLQTLPAENMDVTRKEVVGFFKKQTDM